ncbi:MAG: glycosyltransferase family 2 protein [Bacteroidales bacterium]|nr:glycosyltransferase family 2 protein [Bacteroidales bacterium]
MDKQPFFSIILPTYNRSSFISKAINSVIQQSYSNWELIIVDDESIDDTALVVKPFLSDKIKYFYKKNEERSAARNYGINLSKGQFICFLDSDDYYLNNHLEEFYKIIKSNNFLAALYYCNTYEDNKGELIPIPENNTQGINIIDTIIQFNLGCPRTSLHRDILIKHKFNEKINIGEDTDLWIRVLKKYPLIYNSVYTVVYLAHPDRTVEISNKKSILQHISNINRFIKEDIDKYISIRTQKKIKSEAYYTLAKYYILKKNSLRAIYNLIYAVIIYPSYRLKEKVYLILSMTPIAKNLLTIKKKI